MFEGCPAWRYLAFQSKDVAETCATTRNVPGSIISRTVPKAQLSITVQYTGSCLVAFRDRVTVIVTVLSGLRDVFVTSVWLLRGPLPYGVRFLLSDLPFYLTVVGLPHVSGD